MQELLLIAFGIVGKPGRISAGEILIQRQAPLQSCRLAMGDRCARSICVWASKPVGGESLSPHGSS